MIIISIGRNPSNKIVIDDNTKSVSSNHGELKIADNGSIYYSDVSKNGTMVNGKMLQNSEVQVHRGDLIIFPNNSKLDWHQVPVFTQLPNLKKQITIGKSSDNEIQVHSDNISRYHAVMKITKSGKYYIFDQSMNGTTVNGTKIPKFTDYEIKRGSKIYFANSEQLDWKQVPRAGIHPIYYLSPLLLVLIVAVSYFGYKHFQDVDVSKKYNTSVCLVYNSFYLAYLDGQDTLFYIGENGYVDVKNERYKLSDLKPIEVTGSGFFVSVDGKIVTNKHVAAPWESDLTIDKEAIKSKIGVIDALVNNKIHFNPKIVGVPVLVGIFPNETQMGKSEPFKKMITCSLEKIASEKEIDLALLQTDNKSTPKNCNYVKPDDIISDKSEINVDDDITIIGYPLGVELALKNVENKIKATSNHGKISKISDKYEIQYDAGSTHGASGSPVFNKDGKLIAVNYAGIEVTEGYNFGIIATHIKHLLE